MLHVTYMQIWCKSQLQRAAALIQLLCSNFSRLTELELKRIKIKLQGNWSKVKFNVQGLQAKEVWKAQIMCKAMNYYT